jgi:hypothetical protein
MYKDVLVSMHVMATCVLLILAVQLKEMLIRILLEVR